MKLLDFALLTDENIQTEVVEYLRTLGFDVKDIKEEGLQGSTDEFLLKMAYEEKRVIVTHDSDFGTIIFTQAADFHGISYFRPVHILPVFTIASIDVFMDVNPDLTPPFILVVENQNPNIKIRVRHFS